MIGESVSHGKHMDKPFGEDRREDDRRRRDAPPWHGPERRAATERRLDADWRFAVIRRRMNAT